MQLFNEFCIFFNMLTAYFKTPSISKFEESIGNAAFVLSNGEFFLIYLVCLFQLCFQVF